MICVNDRLCVAGGRNNILAWYIISTDTWLHGPKLELQHHRAAVLHQKNTIVVIGGSQKKVESYDLDTGVWSVGDWEMPKSIKDLHGLVIN